ncbi:MAG: hypothetical protein ACI3ZB_05010 [Prevotella sp.]
MIVLILALDVYAPKPHDTIGLSPFEERPIDADKFYWSVETDGW